MCKNFYLLIVFLIAVNCGFSQKNDIILKGGLNFGKFWGREVSDNTNFKMGYNIGACIDYKINRYYSFQTEMHYIQRGAKFDEPISSVNGGHLYVNEKFHYVGLPLLFKTTLTKKKDINRQSKLKKFWKYFGYIGGEPAYMLQVSHDIKATINGLPVMATFYYPYEINALEFSLIAGLGVKRGDYYLDFRYSLGITNIYRGQNNREMRNQGLNICAGIIF